MKKNLIYGIVALFSLAMISCTPSTDSLIDQYEKACKKGDTKKQLKILVKLHEADLTPEQEERCRQIAIDAAIAEYYGDKDEENSEDWDAVLDSYEKYMDQYIKVMKKVNAGDMNAYSEMMSLTQECNELNAKLASAGKKMTKAQTLRFQKISAKMATAASQR